VVYAAASGPGWWWSQTGLRRCLVVPPPWRSGRPSPSHGRPDGQLLHVPGGGSGHPGEDRGTTGERTGWLHHQPDRPGPSGSGRLQNRGRAPLTAPGERLATCSTADEPTAPDGPCSPLRTRRAPDRTPPPSRAIRGAPVTVRGRTAGG